MSEIRVADLCRPIARRNVRYCSLPGRIYVRPDVSRRIMPATKVRSLNRRGCLPVPTLNVIRPNLRNGEIKRCMITIQNTDSLIGNAALEFEPTVQCGRVMSLGSPEVAEMSVRPKNLRVSFTKTERDRTMVTILNVNRKSRGSRHREPNRRKGLRRPSAVTVAGT